jgi:hypothetical protein
MTGDLDLPTAPPLPPDVRQRALRTVLQRIEDDDVAPSARRRRAPFLAAAAAVVTTLLASLATVGIVAVGPDLRSASPPPVADGSVPLPADPDLHRCAAAVESAGRTADFPPFDTWRVMGVLLQSPGGQDHAIAINDAFACFLGRTAVRLSDPEGHAFGPVAVARLAPALLVVANPQRVLVEVEESPGTWGQGSREPLQIVQVQPGMQGWGTLLRAGGSEGPMPNPKAEPVTVQDRAITTIAPTPGAPPEQQLSNCLDHNLGRGWKLVLVRTVDGRATAMVGRSDSDAVGFCRTNADGLFFQGGRLDSRSGTAVVTAVTDPPGTRIALVRVPAEVTRLEVRSAVGSTPCDRMYDVALCDIPDGGGLYADGTLVPR